MSRMTSSTLACSCGRVFQDSQAVTYEQYSAACPQLSVAVVRGFAKAYTLEELKDPVKLKYTGGSLIEIHQEFYINAIKSR